MIVCPDISLMLLYSVGIVLQDVMRILVKECSLVVLNKMASYRKYAILYYSCITQGDLSRAVRI